MQWASNLRAKGLERTLAGLDLLAVRRGRAANQPPHLLTGIEGEEAAFFYLLRKGYTIVARRWSSEKQPGDLDLVAWQGPVLCFFEVKTRTAHDFAPAEAAVDTHKRNVLKRLARQYIRQVGGPIRPQTRFDLISVYTIPGEPTEFQHFEGAFGWRESGDGGWND